MSRPDRIPLILAACAALIVGASMTAYFTWGSFLDSSPTDTVEAAVSTRASAALPTRLLIPHLGIDALIQHLGVTATGAMASPSNFTDVAWYKYGTIPGQNGSAVIAGHLDNALAINGVFKHLDELKIGQDVQVKTEEGDVLTFRVKDVQAYAYDAVPATELFTKSDASYLNLITCAGTWLPKEKTYDKRLIVYTQLVKA